MVYAVIDTNVFVAALLTKNSDSATVKVYDAIANHKVIEGYRKSGEKITLIDNDYEKATGEIF